MNWLRGTEIRKKLREKKQDPPTSTQPSIGWLYATLDVLERQGFIEKQQAQLTEKELADRGGRGASEFRLTEGGLRRRREVAEKASSPGFNPQLKPQQA